jgi:hypothetical protein
MGEALLGSVRYRCLDRVAISLGVYFCYVGALSSAPFDFTVASLAERTFVTGNLWRADWLVNILGFVPFGAIVYWLTQPTAENFLARWALTIGTAAGVSLAIETAQLFLPGRFSSFADLLANTLGGGLGFWLAHYLRQQPWITPLVRYRRRLALLGVMGYLGGLAGLFLWAALPQRLDTWDPRYPLLIGNNEETRNRHWLGKIFFVALYDHALTAAEVLAQFQAGPNFDPTLHLPGKPIALYTFQEGGGRYVYDRSPVGPSLDLEIAEPQRAAWLPNGGLELTGPTRLHSAQRPEKIYQRVTAEHTFSVAVWVEPKDALQRGPARMACIVSWSPNRWVRNFTLGQVASEIDFRVRTRLAGPNGSRGRLQTNGLDLGPQLTHLVAVSARGTAALYVNGVLFPEGVTGDGLTIIAQELNFDATSRWQRGLLVVLLLGPVAGAVWVLRPR